MLDSFVKIDFKKVAEVEWTGDSDEYDQLLYRLGSKYESFIVYNPFIENHNIIELVDEIPNTEKCIVILYEDVWIAKIFTNGWDIYKGYTEKIITKPKYTWTKNPDLDKLMTFVDDPFGNFDPDPWDSNYTLVWYLDPRFNSGEDKIWAMTCKPIGKKTKGTKDMGFLTPDVTIEYNQEVPELEFNIDSCLPSYQEIENEYAWQLDPIHTDGKEIWVVKVKPNYRKPKSWQWAGIITPQFNITYNPDLPKLEYELDYVIPFHDLNYEHVWLLDQKHLQNNEEDIWAFKIKVVKNTVGSKQIGTISPTVQIETNENLPSVNFEIDYTIPYHDFAYEHVWLLDRKHLQNGEEDIWAIKVRLTDDVVGTKNIDYTSPLIKLETNNDLPKLNYFIEYDIPYHDFAYEHVWLLDRKHLQNGEEDIWVLRAKLTDKVVGTKNIDYVSPQRKIKINNDLPKFVFDIDYVVPWYDFSYKHKWLLDKKYTKEKIWAITLQFLNDTKGEKEIGYLTPLIQNNLDVIFISYKEENAEENWQRVLEKAPWAKRIDGVKGIFNAHQAAAEIATTDMFYVVDGDAYLVDEWKFDFQPNIFDRDCAYVWYSQNPINNLIYGYGGVKLFSKDILLKQKTWTTLDMFTGVMPKLKIMETVSNETRFNVNEFSTWRSSFRECVKLYINKQTEILKIWTTKGKNKKFGKFAINGAKDAIEFAKENIDNYNILLKINDYSWLENKFKEKYV